MALKLAQQVHDPSAKQIQFYKYFLIRIMQKLYRYRKLSTKFCTIATAFIPFLRDS
jgi:hypothetical protein